MTTECNQEPFPFHPLNQREVRGQFDGGSITSDAGGLLLREVEKRTNIIGQFASCFTDYRDPELVEHGVAELVAQRIYGLALGYEDLNDHEELRRDPLLAVLVEKEDVTGEERRRARDQGTALAGKSTLNRMELGAAKLGETERYKKIILDEGAVDRVLVDIFLQVHAKPRKRSCWIWIAPTFLCTGSKKSGSSTATTGITAICRCTSSVASMCCAHVCGRRISMEPKAAWRSWNVLWRRSGKRGRRCGLLCAAIRAFVATSY